ncbi:jg2913 [Pararge aegeria aegeria]|uniref:Jg2913 protein n=1 Tax=Pararge aegeria aegeria TaxID=348720 RepID=A0A8S4SJ28_9NEOP|nr:jg2913 [Pararge aegeria aegeria]
MNLVRVIQSLKVPVHICIATILINHNRQYCRGVPFLSLYSTVFGALPDNISSHLQRKHPKIISLSEESLKCTLQVLSKFAISAEDACLEPHIFCMNPISMDNYGEILKECDFTSILPTHIIRYHTFVKSRTITQLKNKGLLRDNVNMEEKLHEHFHEWPKECHQYKNFQDTNTNILTVRMSVLERYLQWKLCITSDEFRNYCKNYLPLKHRPMCDIKEALNIAENDIKFSKETIRSNGFIISSDPVNTKLILDNVDSLGGMDIRDVIRAEPAILKNNYQAVLEIKNLLTQYNISDDAQQHCLRVYCMRPKTVRERLEQLSNVKEYQILSTNPRVLYMVVHERKMMNRLNKIRAAQKQCYSLNNLVSSTKLFNTLELERYVNFFLKIRKGDTSAKENSNIEVDSTYNNINCRILTDREILSLVLYEIEKKYHFSGDGIWTRFDGGKSDTPSVSKKLKQLELERYVNFFLKIRKGDTSAKENSNIEVDSTYNNINCRILTDREILSLVLYEIEKKYHFSGDGIWTRFDGGKSDTPSVSKKLKQLAYHVIEISVLTIGLGLIRRSHHDADGYAWSFYSGSNKKIGRGTGLLK